MKLLRLSLSLLLSAVVMVGLLSAGRPFAAPAAAHSGDLAPAAAPTGPLVLPADEVPAAVRDGSARLVGPHAATDSLLVMFMLPLRDPAGLDSFLAQVTNPRNPQYGKYLSEADVTARFGPEAAHAGNVTAWLRANGVTDITVPADRLYVLVHAQAGDMARMLGVAINDYQKDGQAFYAPDRAPTLPAAVAADIRWVAGLDTASPMQSDMKKRAGRPAPPTPGRPTSFPPYAPSDFQDAYDTHPLLDTGYTGAGSNIAITLWSTAPSDPTLEGWSADTGSPVPTRANGRLEEIFTDGAPSPDTQDGEAALDIESAGGMAPAAHVRYYETQAAHDANLGQALDLAGSDPTNRIITNSWGGAETTAHRQVMDPILATHTASGHSYFFSSGDDGSWAGGVDPYPDYPAASAYVVSVGGTAFADDINGGWPGETAWVYQPGSPPEGSGGGYSVFETRPSWQTGPGTGGTMRGYPDISAEADPATGAYICGDYDGCFAVGGTSLASPLWAGMATIMDQYLVAQGRPHIGFLTPTLYALAAAAQPYAAFHDITEGTNGAYNTAPNWDAVTGIGSLDLWNLARDLQTFTPPTPAPTQPATPPAATATATRPAGTPTRTPLPSATPRPSATPPRTATPRPTSTPGATATPCLTRFFDVQPTDYFYTPVQYLACRNAISGYSDGTFRPYTNTTRGQLSKIIVAAKGWSLHTAGGPHFSDVPTTNAFYSFIETAYYHGIISGYSDYTFRWGANVTRGQLSKIIVGAQGWATDTTGGPHFSDVPESNPFYAAIETAFHHGAISGYSDGTFRWGADATRGQISKIVYLAITTP